VKRSKKFFEKKWPKMELETLENGVTIKWKIMHSLVTYSKINTPCLAIKTTLMIQILIDINIFFKGLLTQEWKKVQGILLARR